MDTLNELLVKFGGLKVSDNKTKQNDKDNDSKQASDHSGKYESAGWMKQYKFKDIIVPIHDAIFPKFCINLYLLFNVLCDMTFYKQPSI